MLSRKLEWKFEVDEGTGFRSYGGYEDTYDDVMINKGNYEFRRDKRKKLPPMRIVKRETVETIFEVFKEKSNASLC